MKKCNCGSCTTAAEGAVANTTAVLDGHADSCSCGHGHNHDHNHEHTESCGHDHGDHVHDDGCGCGHEHGNREISTIRQDILSIAVAAVVAGAAFLAVPEGIVRTVLLLAAVLVAGLPIFWQGLKNIVRLDLEEMALMTIAVTAAAIIGELPEGLLVTVLFRIGGILEDLAVARSRREVEAITNIIPDNANLVAADGSTTAISAKELAIGSKILIKSGERVPVDSVVLSGHSSLDTSSLTGESAPREVAEGDAILSGTVNLGGILTCETRSTFDNSTASKIVEMVKDSAAKKGNTERLISKFARVYTPIVIAVAVLVAVLPPVLGYGTFPDWIGRSLVFLVASCPCALVISIPLSFFAGIGALSTNGVLVKGSRYVEALAAAETVVFDKTGTLTTGKLSVSGVHAASGVMEAEVLRLAAVCESYSNHPIARAVVEAYGTPDTSGVDSCEEITSYGMKAAMGADEVLCGSERLMKKYGVDISALPAANVYVAKNGGALGAVSVFDNPREDAADTIKALKAMGVSRTVMLTGDSAVAAEKTAAMVGVGDVRAELLPADKVTAFESVKEQSGGRVLFVGDGINDSPVLARADAGVAMGLASDAAIEAADVVLLSDRLASLPQAIRISRRTGRLARFNITFALGVKLLVFVLAVFGVASMWMAVFADVGVTVLSVLNATRALRFK